MAVAELTLTPTHRRAIKLNYLLGITAGDWLKLRRTHRVNPTYRHRAALITLISGFNSMWRAGEARKFGRAIAETAVKSPVFILGHWRSGTTWLLTMLGLDRARFAYPTSYQVANPYTFLSTERVLTRCFAGLLPAKRPMDEMPLSFQSPQEDEFALCLMTGLSVYLGMSFPRHKEYYLRYLTFAGVSRDDITRWKEAFIYFLKKLSLRNPGKTLLLKSPPHTAKIRLLLEMFPEACFIHLYRHPYRVYQSTWHLYNTMGWYLYLQHPQGIADFILRQYRVMYDAFFEQKQLIPTQQYCEVRFEDFERAPMPTVAAIYRHFNWAGYERVKPRLADHLTAMARYRQNTYPPLPPTTRDKVAALPTFDAWHYAP